MDGPLWVVLWLVVGVIGLAIGYMAMMNGPSGIAPKKRRAKYERQR